jgi:hypothetical protein
VRTKAMALVGASIGLIVSSSLVAAPMLAARIGLHGLFTITGLLALGCIAVVPGGRRRAAAARQRAARPPGRRAEPRRLLRLDVGVFVLHAVQLAMWVAVPALLVQPAWPRRTTGGLPARRAGSFVVMGGAVPLERRGYLRAVFLRPIGLVLAGAGGPVGRPPQPSVRCWRRCCSCSSAASTCWRPPSPAWPRGWRRRIARRRAGCVQHPAIPGIFAGGAVGGWLAKNVGWAGLFGGLRGHDAGLAGGRLAHACSAGRRGPSARRFWPTRRRPHNSS